MERSFSEGGGTLTEPEESCRISGSQLGGFKKTYRESDYHHLPYFSQETIVQGISKSERPDINPRHAGTRNPTP